MKNGKVRRVRWQRLVMGVLGLVTLCVSKAQAVVTIYPTPNDLSVSTARFGVKINGTSSAVYDFFDQKTYNWATTSEPHFTAFTTDQSITVAITTTFSFNSYVIRPLSKNITATRSGNTLTFTMPTSARQLSIEFDGDAKKPLLIFSNPPEANPPTASTSKYIDYSRKFVYYPPGATTDDWDWIYGPDYDGWTFYLAGGAILKADIGAAPKNITIKGPGIWAFLSGSGSPINVTGNNFTMKDTIVVNRREEWTAQVRSADNTFDNIKILSEVRDGFNVVNGRRVTLKNSYIMSHDDSICMKGQWYGNGYDVDTVTIENCVISQMGGGSCLEIGYEAEAPNIKNVTYQNLDLIHELDHAQPDPASWPTGAITMHLNGKARVSNILYDDIRIEDNRDVWLFDFSYKGSGTSDTDGVTVKNVRVVGGPRRPSRIAGKDNTAMIKNVSFIDLKRQDGAVVTSASQGDFAIGNYTSNITFTSSSSNLLSNSSFDADNYNTQTPSGWSEWSNGNYDAGYTESNSSAHSGTRYGVHWKNSAYQMYTYQTKAGLANGLYTVRAWVQGSGGQSSTLFGAKNYGGTGKSASIPTTNTWTKLEVKDINVTNGQCEVYFWSDANAGNWITFDDVELVKQ